MNLKTYNGNDKTAVYCYAFMACATELAISHSDTTLYPDWLRRIYLYSIFAALFIALIFVLRNNRKDTTSFLIPVIYFLFVNIHSNYAVTGDRLFDAIYSSLRIVGFLLLMPLAKIKVYECLKAFMVFVSACGILVFISHILHIPIPHNEVPYYTDSVFASYVDYKIGILFSELGAIRLCGLFNEPGAFGTILALVLCIENYDIRKRDNQLLAVAGICSFSVAFVVISVLYFIMKVRNNRKIAIPLILLMISVVFIIPNIEFSDPLLRAFVNRLKFDDGALVADTRSSNFIDEAFSNVLNSDKIFFGYKARYLEFIDYENASSTFKIPFIEHGMIGFFIIYGILLINALKKAKGFPLAIMFIICFMFSVYQRPNIYSLTYFVLLYGGIDYIKSRDSITQ